MINWLKKTLGIKPDEKNLLAHYYYQNEFIRNSSSFKITRIEPAETLIFLNVFQTNAAQIEIKSLHTTKHLDLIKLPENKHDKTIFHLRNKKYQNITLTIDKKEAILELNDLNIGSIFSKSPRKEKKTSNERKLVQPILDKSLSNNQKEDIIIFKTNQRIDVEKKFENSKYGISLSDSNQWIVPPIYDQILFDYADDFEKRYAPKDHIDVPYFLAYKDEKNKEHRFYFLRLNSITLVLKVKSLLGLKTVWGEFYQYKVGNKIGYIKGNGEQILETESDENADFNNSNSSLITWNKIKGNYEILHLIKEKKIPLELEGNVKILYPFQEDYTVIESNDKLGLINLLGDVTVPCNFEEIGDIVNHKAIAKLDSGYGVITTSNKKVVEFKYDEITYSQSIDSYLTKIKDKYGLVTGEGTEILPPEYDEITKINSTKNIFRVKKGEYCGFANLDKITQIFYDDTPPFFGYTQYSEGLLRVKRNGKIGFLDENLNEIIPCKFSEGSVSKNGKILVMFENSLKFINSVGEEIDYNPVLAMNYNFENDERIRSFKIL